ncbi:unnamed protein product, partial [Porites lobata]
SLDNVLKREELSGDTHETTRNKLVFSGKMLNFQPAKRKLHYLFIFFLVFTWLGLEGALAMQGCGAVMNNTLKSPRYPSKYPGRMDCVYR